MGPAATAAATHHDSVPRLGPLHDPLFLHSQGLGKDSGDTKVSEAVAKRRPEGRTQAQGEWKSVRRAAGSSPRRPADERGWGPALLFGRGVRFEWR